MEEKFLTAIEDVRINKAPIAEVEKILRRCMLKVGMRANNLPNEEEGVVLYEHLINFYGNLKLDELRLAFDLATSGQIEAPETFENFSCAYLGKVLKSYAAWANKTYNQYRSEIEKPKKAITMEDINWRGSVQTAFDSYNSGKYERRLWLTELYDQLVYDEYVPALYYKEFIQEERRLLCEGIQKEITQIESVINTDSSKLGLHKDLQNRLIDYRNGNRDKEVILASKQMAILNYFGQLKERGISKIYVKE